MYLVTQKTVTPSIRESERRNLLNVAKVRGCTINWSHEGVHWFEVPMRMTLLFESHIYRVDVIELEDELQSLRSHYQSLLNKLTTYKMSTDQHEQSIADNSIPGARYIDMVTGKVTDLSPDQQRIHNENLPTEVPEKATLGDAMWDSKSFTKEDCDAPKRATEAQIAQADVDRKEE